MRPQSEVSFGQKFDLFRSKLKQILNRKHPLFKLADAMDWNRFDLEFGAMFCEDFGRPALPTRLMVGLRQTFERMSKKALLRQSRYAHAKQMRRARSEMRKLRIYLGRVMRDIRRKVETPDEEIIHLLALAERLFQQKREDSNKLYSIHAPEVECISKGKAHKRYEFGCKVSVATTSKNNWVVGIQALHGNPYDGHTLPAALQQIERLTGVKPEFAFCDRGYRGAEKLVTGTQVIFKRYAHFSQTMFRWLKRRAAIEPIIGHLKHGNGMDRNHLLGQIGDKHNALMAGSGRNLRKLLRAFFLFQKFWRSLFQNIEIHPMHTPQLQAF